MDAVGEDGGKKLWDGYRIVSDVIICSLTHEIISHQIYPTISHSQLTFHELTSMNSCRSTSSTR